MAVPVLGDWCEVQVVGDDGSLRPVALAHVVPEKEALAHALQRRYPTYLPAGDEWDEALREGQAVIYAELSDEALSEFACDADHLALLRELGPKSAMFVPLIARGSALGFFTLMVTESSRRYGAADLALAQVIATTAALDADTARLYQGEQTRRHQAEERTRQLESALAQRKEAEAAVLEINGRLRAALAELEAAQSKLVE